MSTLRRFESKPRPTPTTVLAEAVAETGIEKPLLGDKRAKRQEAPRGAKLDHFQDMTDRIIQSIEDGVIPWRQDWDGSLAWPCNGTTGRPYHGINVPMLLSMRYQDDRWATFNQARAEGWKVRKGEKGSPIYFHTMAEREVGIDPESGDPVTKKYPHMRRFIVFNFSQIDGAPGQEFKSGQRVVNDLIAERIEDMVAAMGVEVAHGFRVPEFQYGESGVDRICMPSQDSFESDAAYYAAKLHELVHWTGHPDRLNRVFARDRQSPEYAREELRAEIGSALLCAKLGIPYAIEGHASYVENYLKLLRSDKREIYRASRDAERIVTHILAHHSEYRDEIRAEAGAMAADAKAAGLEEHFDAAMFDYDDDLIIDADVIMEGYQP